MTKKELEVKLEQTEKALADYQFNYPSIKELEQENAALKNEIVNLKGVIESLSEQRDGLEKEKCELLGIIQGKDKAIKDLEWQLQEVAKDNDVYQAENKRLEKENAELKEGNKELQKLVQQREQRGLEDKKIY